MQPSISLLPRQVGASLAGITGGAAGGNRGTARKFRVLKPYQASLFRQLHSQSLNTKVSIISEIFISPILCRAMLPLILSELKIQIAKLGVND